MPAAPTTLLVGQAEPEVEPVEWFVQQQNWLRRQQTGREERSLVLSLRKRTDARGEELIESEGANDTGARSGVDGVKAGDEPQDATDRLIRPWPNPIRDVEEDVFPVGGAKVATTS